MAHSAFESLNGRRSLNEHISTESGCTRTARLRQLDSLERSIAFPWAPPVSTVPRPAILERTRTTRVCTHTYRRVGQLFIALDLRSCELSTARPAPRRGDLQVVGLHRPPGRSRVQLQ